MEMTHVSNHTIAYAAAALAALLAHIAAFALVLN